MGQPRAPTWPPEREPFLVEHDWRAVYQLAIYAPELNLVEGIWALLRRGPLADTDTDHLIATIGQGLRHIQYRSHLINGCLTETRLTPTPNRPP